MEHHFEIKLVVRVNWATNPVVRAAAWRMVEDGSQALLRPAQPKPKGCQFPRALCRDQGLGSSLVCTPCATCKAQHHARVIARTVDGGLKCSAWQGERIWQCLPGGRPRELFSNKPINVQRLTTKP